MIKKLISCGVTDVDRAALDAAVKLGISHGGWTPKGGVSGNEPLPSKYKLSEMTGGNYDRCIERNVMDARGTLILTYGRLSGTFDYARRTTLRQKRQLLGVDLNQNASLKAASLIHGWIQLQRIDVIYVTGSSAGGPPDGAGQAGQVVESALLLDLMEIRHDPGAAGLAGDSGRKKGPSPPRSVREAVDLLVAAMPLKERAIMANLKREEIKPLNLSLGIYIRNHLLKTDVNRELLESCCAVSGNNALSDSGAAFVIIEKLWERLRDTHRIRVVK